MLTYSRAVRPQQCRDEVNVSQLHTLKGSVIAGSVLMNGMKLCACSGDIRYCGGLHYGMVQCMLCNKRDKLQGPPEPDISATSFGRASKSNNTFQV